VEVSPSSGGTVEVNEDLPSSYPTAIEFSSGELAHATAVPAPGYTFDNWSGDLTDDTNPTDITMDCDKKITANFSQIMHALTMQVSGSGSTTPTVGTHSYSEGTVINITATPSSGWQFDSWIGDLSGTANLASIVIDGDKNITANFSQLPPSWWLIGGIVAGVIIVGAIIWLGFRI
jgi:uncharacterized repeat protein (TIGR02543 family)